MQLLAGAGSLPQQLVGLLEATVLHVLEHGATGPVQSVFGLERGGHFGVRAVTGFYRDHMTVDAYAGEHQVADDVERLGIASLCRCAA